MGNGIVPRKVRSLVNGCKQEDYRGEEDLHYPRKEQVCPGPIAGVEIRKEIVAKLRVGTKKVPGYC